MPPAIAKPQTDTIIFGFDSAWSDKSPGAICALAFDKGTIYLARPMLSKRLGCRSTA